MFGSRPGGDSAPARNVREVRSDAAAGIRARTVWHIAQGPAQNISLSALFVLTVCRIRRRLALRAEPLLELLRRLRNDGKRHVGVLGAAVLRALSAKDAGASARIIVALSCPGIRSVLPCRFGTQKLWITSVDCSVISTGRPTGNVDLVRGGEQSARGRRSNTGSPTTTGDP